MWRRGRPDTVVSNRHILVQTNRAPFGTMKNESMFPPDSPDVALLRLRPVSRLPAIVSTRTRNLAARCLVSGPATIRIVQALACNGWICKKHRRPFPAALMFQMIVVGDGWQSNASVPRPACNSNTLECMALAMHEATIPTTCRSCLRSERRTPPTAFLRRPALPMSRSMQSLFGFLEHSQSSVA
jgi:hypothetical protein